MRLKKSLRTKVLQTAAFLTLSFAAGPLLLAQASASSISGTVTDPSGSVVPGATVTITNQATGVPHAGTTDNGGFYSAEGLSVGQYKIDITKPGFKESITSGIQIDPGQRRSNNVRLEVGNATSEVTVTANALQVNTESSESGGTISSEQIDNLMLNGRNFQTLAIAIPGVSQYQRCRCIGWRWA